MRLFDHPFHASAIERTPVPGRVQYIAHGDERIDVENEGEVAIILNLTADHRVSGRLDGRYSSDNPLVNSVTVMPPGCRFAFQIEGNCRVLAVRVPLAGREHDGERCDAIEPRLNVFDPELAGFVWRTATAPADECEGALSLLADHLCLPPKRRRGMAIGGIAAARLRHVLDFVEAGISAALPLADLARVAGMSSFHFARAFAASTGTTPHRYVVGRRVAHAITALGANRSVDDVAWECGFANASHLGHHVRRTTGATPRYIRDLSFDAQ